MNNGTSYHGKTDYTKDYRPANPVGGFQQYAGKQLPLPTFEDVHEVEDDFIEVDAVIEQFACYCLRLSNEIKGDSLEQVFEDYEEAEDFDETIFLQSFIENYSAFFEKFFDGFGVEDMIMFKANTEEVINALNDFEELYPLAVKVNNILRIILIELIKIENE